MKITPSGIPVGGVASSGVYVNNQHIKDGGTATTDGTRVWYQSTTATVRSCELDGSADRLEFNQGASLIVAGGGHSAIWLAPSAGAANTGLTASWGLRLGDAAVMSMTDTGDLLALVSYSTGKGLAMYLAGSSTASWALPNAAPIIRYPYPQAFALDAERVVWANPAGLLFSRGLPPPAQVMPAFDPCLVTHPTGTVWLGYHTNDGRFLLHPIDDASRGYIVATGLTFGTTATGRFVGYSRNAGESQMVVQAVDWSQPLVPLVNPPLPPDHFRPVSEPRPEGYVIPDLAPFVIGHPSTFPRKDTHTVTQTQANGHTYWGKFYDPDKSFLSKKHYEDWVIGEKFVHHIADVHETIVQSLSDTRWMPRRCQVGFTHAFRPDPHELIDRNRATCAIVDRRGWSRLMAVVNSWAQFDCGRDLGVRELSIVMCDNTGGVHGPDRGVELYYCAFNAGVLRWEYHRSDRVYETTPPQFNDYTRVSRSDFYHLGGTPWVPEVASCSLPITPEVIEVPSMKIPLSVQTTMHEMAARFGNPPAGDGPIHEYSRRMAEQVKFRHDTPTSEWGLKARSSGAPTSNNLTLRDAAGIHTWDWIIGSGGDSPQLNIEDAEYFFVPDQHFIPVQAVDHLGTPLPPSKFPPLVLPFWGVTAFDLAAAVSKGDVGYYDLIRTKRLVGRVQCYATIDHPATGRHYRDFSTGLAQLRQVLPKMAAEGFQAQFCYLVGTTPDQVSRGEAINRIRQLDALVCSYPTVVRGRQGGNELYYPGLEESYMSEDAFWREVEAVIDPRFPWTRGAGHGGGGVNQGAGSSYLVDHPDRGQAPDQSFLPLIAAVKATGRNGVIDEPQRVEAGGSGQSHGDLNIVAREIALTKEHKLGYTLHPASGRGCSLALMDPTQRAAIEMVSAEVQTAPPPVTHPILDVWLPGSTPDSMSDAGYNLIVFNRRDVEALCANLYEKKMGHPAGDSDIAMLTYIRGVKECHRWGTFRKAWEGILT